VYEGTSSIERQSAPAASGNHTSRFSYEEPTLKEITWHTILVNEINWPFGRGLR
jgi:hypothetical protein